MPWARGRLLIRVFTRIGRLGMPRVSHCTCERSSPWSRAATCGTPSCAPRGVDMISRRDHPQRPRGRHTRPVRRPADMHREGHTGGHGWGTTTAGRATLPSCSRQAGNPGSAAHTGRQSWRATGCTHGAKQGAADLQGARSQGARSHIRGGGRRARAASHTRASDEPIRAAGAQV